MKSSHKDMGSPKVKKLPHIFRKRLPTHVANWNTSGNSLRTGFTIYFPFSLDTLCNLLFVNIPEYHPSYLLEGKFYQGYTRYVLAQFLIWPYGKF